VTAFVNGGQLTATIPASDIATPHSPATVFNPALGAALVSADLHHQQPLPALAGACLRTRWRVGRVHLTVNGASL
jgi:hypothetical protein